MFYKIEQGHVHLTEFEVELFYFFLKYFSFSWILPQPLFLTNPLFPLNYTFVRFWLRCQMMQKNNCSLNIFQKQKMCCLTSAEPNTSVLSPLSFFCFCPGGRQHSFLLIQQPSMWIPEVFGVRRERVTGIRCQEMLPRDTVQNAAHGDVW